MFTTYRRKFCGVSREIFVQIKSHRYKFTTEACNFTTRRIGLFKRIAPVIIGSLNTTVLSRVSRSRGTTILIESCCKLIHIRHRDGIERFIRKFQSNTDFCRTSKHSQFSVTLDTRIRKFNFSFSYLDLILILLILHSKILKISFSHIIRMFYIYPLHKNCIIKCI